MKKLYFALFTVLVMPLLISFRVFAYDGLTKFQEDCHNIGLYPSDSWLQQLDNAWSANPDYKGAFFVWSDALNGALGDNVYFSGQTLYYSRGYFVYFNTVNNAVNSTSGGDYGPVNGGTKLFYNSYEEASLPGIDYDNPIFSSAIPVPDMTVTFVGVGLTLPSNTNGVYVDCIVPEEEAFYIQLQAKYSVCDLVQINLNNGVISYEYLDWYDGDNVDIYGLQDNESSVHVTASEFQTSWNTLINSLLENSSFPQFTSNVPFWVQNPTAQKYLDAQSRYKNVLMRQAPLYGSRMELFARYYAIVDDSVYVGRWIHWNSANPSNTEELGSKYQEDQPFPGYQNTSSDNDLPEQENTYTNFGENTSVDNNPYTQVIVNNNVPNYPDYPTVATYNHDNILVQFINTAKQLPNFFGDFGSFLTTSFAFIPSYIWAVIGFGFMCSIVVMIIKIL